MNYCKDFHFLGLAYVNPDGTPYKHMPGQPLPQSNPQYSQLGDPQQHTYHMQQQHDWTSVSQVGTQKLFLAFRINKRYKLL